MATPNFIDGTSVCVDTLNNLLQTYMPLRVVWTIGTMSCTLQLAHLTIRINNEAGIDVTATSDTIPRIRLDLLRQALRDIVQAALSEPAWSTMSFGVMLLQLGEEALAHVEAFAGPSGWDATSGDWQSVLSNSAGVDLHTVNDTAQFLLGKSITQILADLPEELHVLHVEPVFRDDLVAKFTHKRRKMREHLATMSCSSLRQCVDKTQLRGNGNTQSRAETMADILTTPKVTFHGAPRNVMQSIVRYGFVIPGQKIGETGVANGIVCGASFGIGVYSSPSIEFASTYAYDDSHRGEWRNPADVPGIRIVVCATLMGRPIQVSRAETRRTEGLFDEQADSHVSPNGLEYIVFDTAQIIPCYVLHLDYGSERARKHFDAFRNKPRNDFKSQSRLQSRVDSGVHVELRDCPAAKQARKEALKAAASKWFPYGFGPATGSNFVIEEIGDVSDDEEEYGEYQELRGQQESEWEALHLSQAEEKTSWFDEFQTVRITKKQVQVK
jgi:hypothetical protein